MNYNLILKLIMWYMIRINNKKENTIKKDILINFYIFFSIKCNDKVDGQLGSERNCDGSQYIIKKMPLCEENGCKEGYYNKNIICSQCSIKIVNCVKCSYSAPSGNSYRVFKFFEYFGWVNGEYRLINGICQTCKNKSGCQECSYVRIIRWLYL